MTLKRYLTIMGIATSVCWLLWLYIIFSIDPWITNLLGFILFYTSLSLAMIGSFALVGFFVRFVALKQILAFHSVKEAFRQSFLFSLLIIISLNLLSKGLFTWLNLFFLVTSLSVLEFFLLSYEKA
jgi:hypothetical protein